MEEKIKIKCPKYLEEFKCIGGACEDSCCTAWDIDIDKESFKIYKDTDNEVMKKMFEEELYENKEKSDDNVDFGRVKLKPKKRCAFLDSDNLCIIYKNLGEEYLSNVCTCFPRILNKLDSSFEMSLDVSCPEASRILLSKESGIEFIDKEIILTKRIISSELDTNDNRFSKTPLKYFKKIREKSINIIKDRSFKLNERMYILGEFLYALEYENYNDFSNLENLINTYDTKKIYDDYGMRDISFIDNVEFYKDLIEGLDVFNEIDNEIFKEYARKLYDGFKFNIDSDDISIEEEYIEGYKEYNEKFEEEFSYIFENYLVNFMYNYMFPFSESDYMFDGYMMLLIRYSYIKFCLVGVYLNDKKENKDNIIRFISAFSKAVGHHKTYMIELLNYVREEELDNMEFVKMLLPKYI